MLQHKLQNVKGELSHTLTAMCSLFANILLQYYRGQGCFILTLCCNKGWRIVVRYSGFDKFHFLVYINNKGILKPFTSVIATGEGFFFKSSDFHSVGRTCSYSQHLHHSCRTLPVRSVFVDLSLSGLPERSRQIFLPRIPCLPQH